MIYLDSSALMKLVRQEQESQTLGEWLAEQSDEALVSSELSRVEVLRAARRLGSLVLAEARAVVDELDLVPLDRVVQDVACDIGDPLLRYTSRRRCCSAAS